VGAVGVAMNDEDEAVEAALESILDVLAEEYQREAIITAQCEQQESMREPE
jgi:hypothetical protein